MKALLLAGEESGVLYANQIRAEILRRCPNAEIRGYADYGFKIEDLSVMGFGQVLKRIFYFLGVKRTMERAIDDWKPDIVCTVDYPGLNLKLAAYAKARSVRAVHVVCPQVWAWKRGRIPKIEAALDRLCCFFPFEPKLFRDGFATFVGHPLVDEMARENLNTEAQRHSEGKMLAMLPGSRLGEIEKILPILLQVAQGLQKSLCLGAFVLKIIIPAANDRAYRAISSYVSRLKSSAFVLEVRRGGAREVLRQADAAVVASGTATLEAALAGCPTVLVYRVGWLLAVILRILIRGVKHVGLANIIAEKAGAVCPMPELLQEQFTVDNVLVHLKPWLTDEDANKTARRVLGETMGLLRSESGAIARIVDELRLTVRCMFFLTFCTLACGAFAEAGHVTLADRPRPASKDPNNYRVKAAYYRDREAERLRDADVVLLGDSITHYFEWPQNQPIWKQWFDSPEAPFKGLNQAIEGDTTDNLLWRMDLSLAKTCPKAFVVQIGTNNTGTRNEKTEPPEDTVKGLKRVLDEIARVHPQAKTLVYALFPRGKGVTDPCTIRNEKVNAGLEKLCDGKKFIFRDIRKAFLAGDGTVNTNRLFDRLHPAPEGYRVWMADMAPQLKKIFAAFDADKSVRRAYWERYAARARQSSRPDEERRAAAELKKLGTHAVP